MGKTYRRNQDNLIVDDRDNILKDFNYKKELKKATNRKIRRHKISMQNMEYKKTITDRMYT